MAGSVNKAILIGNLGKDPEIRAMRDGEKVATLSLATSETWNDRQSGERKERTEWHRVVIFNERICDFAEKYLRKGRKVFVEGAMQTRKWTDQGGVDRYTTEVVISRFRGELVTIDSGGRGDESESGATHIPGTKQTPSVGQMPQTADHWAKEPAAIDDEIPF